MASTELVGRQVGKAAAAAAHKVQTTSLISTYEELQDALSNGYPVTVCSNQGFALGFMDLVARDAAAWETFPEALQAVTAEDVLRVAKEYLVKSNYSVVTLEPGKAETP